MAYDIGPKIGIDGEAEFRKSINNITQNVKTLGTEMASVTSAYDKNDKSTANLTAQNEVLNKQITAQKEKLEKLTDGLAECTKKYGENDNKTLKWQAAVNTATAELNKMERQLTENNQALEQQGGTMDKLKEKLKSFGSGVGSVVSAAAKGIAAFAASAAAAAGAVGKMVADAAYAADDINTLAKQTGLSTEEIQKFQFATEQIDVPLDTLTGSLAKMTKNMATASKGSGDAYEAFKALGVEITNQDGTLRDRNEVFNEAIKALGEMSNETQRDAYAMQIFGKSAQDLNPLILGGVDALQELGDQAEEAGLILSQDSLDKLNLVSDAIDTFKATASGAGNLFSVGFAEPIAKGINTVTGYMTRLTSAFSAGGMEGLAEEVGGVMTDLVGTLTSYLPQIVEFGTNIVVNLVSGVASMLPDIATAAIDIVTMLVDTISEQLPTLIPVAIDAVLQLAETLTDPDSLGNMVDSAIELITSLAEGLVDAIPKLIEKAPEIISNLVTALSTNAPKLLSAAVEIIAKLASGLITNIPNLIKAIPQIVSSIVKGFGTYMSQIKDIGKNIVNGIWEGIKGMATWLQNKVSGFFSGIVDGAKSLLGISSPSKVFAGIGGYMAEGLGVGFGKEIPDIQRRIDRSMNELVNSASGYTIPGQTAGAGVSAGAQNPSSTDLAAAIKSAMAGMGVYLGNRQVGEIVTNRQRNNARASGAMVMTY